MLVLLATAACGKKGPTDQPSTTPPASGTQTIANPASVNCIDKGGTLEIVDTPEGQQGICTLKDGTKCEEWAYMRGECPCGPCPEYVPPAPGFCEGGTITEGGVDACGCSSPPSCQMPPCGECPQYAPPAPGFCKGGTIVPGDVDACGCQGHPICQRPSEG